MQISTFAGTLSGDVESTNWGTEKQPKIKKKTTNKHVAHVICWYVSYLHSFKKGFQREHPASISHLSHLEDPARLVGSHKSWGFFRLIRRLSSLVGEENIGLIMAADEGERGQEEKRRSRNHRSQLPVSAIKAKSGEGSRMRKTRRGQVARKT